MIDIYVSIVIYFIYASHKYYPIFFLKIIISGEFDRPVHIIDHRWQHGLRLHSKYRIEFARNKLKQTILHSSNHIYNRKS